MVTLDKIPYVGPVTKAQSNVFVATGFRKWGMTNGTNAALLISDLITEKDNPFKEFFRQEEILNLTHPFEKLLVIIPMLQSI